MNLEIRTEAAQFLFREYLNGIFVAVLKSPSTSILLIVFPAFYPKENIFHSGKIPLLIQFHRFMREFKFNIVTLIVGKAFKSFQPGGALHLSRYFSSPLPSPFSLIPTPLSPLYTLLFFILQPTIFLIKILISFATTKEKCIGTISFCLKNNIL
jgi:hypothetical protein